MGRGRRGEREREGRERRGRGRGATRVVGVSMGGMIAQHVALIVPEVREGEGEGRGGERRDRERRGRRGRGRREGGEKERRWNKGGGCEHGRHDSAACGPYCT